MPVHAQACPSAYSTWPACQPLGWLHNLCCLCCSTPARRLESFSSLSSSSVSAEALDVQPLPWPLVDESQLLPRSYGGAARPAAPCPLTVDQLLFGADAMPSSAPAAGPAAAYSAQAQVLAWGAGLTMTFAAACTVPCQLCAPAAAAPATAVEVELDESWQFVFCCLEVAAQLGRPATYAAVLRG